MKTIYERVHVSHQAWRK